MAFLLLHIQSIYRYVQKGLGRDVCVFGHSAQNLLRQFRKQILLSGHYGDFQM